jgi:hypothetical protein
VTQHALGGHSIPLNRGALITLHTVGVITDDEFAKGIVPGLERAVSKNKGTEVGSLLHQLGVEVGRNPYGPNARKLMLEIDPGCKDRLPKRPTKPPEPAPAPPPPEPAKKPGAGKSAAKGAATKGAPAKTTPPEKPAGKKPVEKKSIAKSPPPAKKKARPQVKKATKKGTKKPTIRRLTKRKPR